MEKGQLSLSIEIGKKLKQLRIKKGYASYEIFAIDNDLDRKQYWRVESGANITLKTLEKILVKHNLKVKDFFSDFEF